MLDMAQTSTKRRNIMIAVILFVFVVVALIAGILIYNNGLKNSTNPTPTPTPTPSPVSTSTPTPTVTPTNNPSESLSITNYHGGSVNNNWNATCTVKNTGATTATITDVVVNGQSYKNFSPALTINPSIANGYLLPQNQSINLTIQGTTDNPFHNGGKIYIVTAIGNTYLIWQSTG